MADVTVAEKQKAILNLVSVLAGTGVTLGVISGDAANVLTVEVSKYAVLAVFLLQLISAVLPHFKKAFGKP